MKKFLFALTTIVLSSHAIAEESWITEIKQLKKVKADKLCQAERDQNTIAAQECYDKEFKKSDKKLNTFYNSYFKSLPLKDQKILKTAQRGWIKYKESDCVLASNAFEGGSWQGILRIQCQIDKTNQRSIELLKLKNCSMESPANICD